MTLDPRDADPFRAEGTDDLEPFAQWVAGYDAGYAAAARMPAVRALFLGILLGIAGALGAIAVAAHRS